MANVQFDASFGGDFYVPTHVPTGATMTGAFCRVRNDVGGAISPSVYIDVARCGSNAVSTVGGDMDLLVSDCSSSVLSSLRITPIHLDIVPKSGIRLIYRCWVRYTSTGIH